MYSITPTGIIKKLESWQLILPLIDNSGNRFPKELIDDILENIGVAFPGYTMINCMGFWKDQTQTYKDENLQVIIDTLPSASADTTAYFSNLKSDLCKTLSQEKIYVVRTGSKEELISFNEFFSELGLEINESENSNESNALLAEQIVSNQEFIHKRLAYETLVLQRDKDAKKIIWERKIFGIRLRTEFEDSFSPEATICAADQIDEMGDAIFRGSKEIAIIGDYEYQGYLLDKIAYKPLVEADWSEHNNGNNRFVDQQGNPISTKRFIELFSMTIFSNYSMYREENFQQHEIRINVGKDGSMQTVQSPINGNYVFHCPAMIPDKEIQLAVIKCLDTIIAKFETNQLDSIALQQAKARNSYIRKRAMLRKAIANR